MKLKFSLEIHMYLKQIKIYFFSISQYKNICVSDLHIKISLLKAIFSISHNNETFHNVKSKSRNIRFVGNRTKAATAAVRGFIER